MKTRFVLPILACLTLGGCAVVSALANIEEPRYKVLNKEGEFELREYPPMIVAETVVSGTLDEASDRGFRVIANYIFGNNLAKTSPSAGSEKIAMTTPVTMEAVAASNLRSERSGEKIAMTAPVTMQSASATNDTAWRMHFIMPSRYNMTTLPTPKNPAVVLRELPPQRFAAYQFSGFSGTTKVAEKTALLQAWMAKTNLTAGGAPQLARYNPPLTPPPFRRNEILIPVN